MERNGRERQVRQRRIEPAPDEESVGRGRIEQFDPRRGRSPQNRHLDDALAVHQCGRLQPVPVGRRGEELRAGGERHGQMRLPPAGDSEPDGMAQIPLEG